jgi:predicted RNase H-like HicB family nuclease
MQITFEVTPCDETGGYVARWDDPAGGGISTQGDSFADLDGMVRDAVEGYFADRERPDRIWLHFVRDPELLPA